MTLPSVPSPPPPPPPITRTSLLHRRCDACIAAADPLSCAQPRPVAGFPLLKRTHPDAGLHTPCYSCPTHTHALPLAAPHVATLGSRVLQIRPPFRQTCLPASIAKQLPPLLRFRLLRIPSSPTIPFRFRATLPSQVATCASLCVASSRNAHDFTRAID